MDASSNRECDDCDDNVDLEVRRRPPMKQSYSSRVLAVNAQEKEEVQKLKEEVSKRMSRTIMPEENDETSGEEEDDDYDDMEEESNDPAKQRKDKKECVEPRAGLEGMTIDCDKESSSVPSFARNTGASRNTRIAAADLVSRGTKSTGPPTRHGSSGSSSALRASALAAARARAAGRVSAAGRGSPRVTSIKTSTTSGIRSTSATGTRSNIAPRRVTAVTARK
jgi:hypothetical protein